MLTSQVGLRDQLGRADLRLRRVREPRHVGDPNLPGLHLLVDVGPLLAEHGVLGVQVRQVELHQLLEHVGVVVGLGRDERHRLEAHHVEQLVQELLGLPVLGAIHDLDVAAMTVRWCDFAWECPEAC
jgi:hypothetical protein